MQIGSRQQQMQPHFLHIEIWSGVNRNHYLKTVTNPRPQVKYDNTFRSYTQESRNL